MFKTRFILFALMIVSAKLWASDPFAAIKCGADIPKALIGKRESNERVALLEERHKDLGLKDLGGSEISDRLFLASWQICGSEYDLMLETKSGVIRDVLAFPAHSPASPQFIGACVADGKQVSGTVLAILKNNAGYNARDEKLAKTMLKATAAWKIDETKEKFVNQLTENLSCPLDGIVTQDGGP